MNKLQKFLGIGVLALGLAGCKEQTIDYEYSNIKHERAVVTYKNESRGLRWIGRMSYLYERYEITFKGKIEFELEDEEMYGKFNSNDIADVSYREVYTSLSTYDDTNNSGTNCLIEKKFVDSNSEFTEKKCVSGYDFVDARLIRKSR